MNHAKIVDVLDRLLQTLCRSLPMYLQEAKPWIRRDEHPAEAAMDHLAADQRTLAERVAEAILEHGGRPEMGRFPLEFAATNDLSVDFLLQKVVDRQRQDIATIEQCVDALAEAPLPKSLAEEIQGNAPAHLDILEELQATQQENNT